MATIDGNFDLGSTCTIVYVPNMNVQQQNEFFGVNGTQTVFGGTRGAVLQVTGILGNTGYDVGSLNVAEANLLSYADGNIHTIVDDRGRTWNNVVFKAEYQPDPKGIMFAAGGGWCLSYHAIFQIVA